MNYDMKRSGERIRQLRIQKGFTQERIAEELNIDQSFFGRIETGKKGCSVDLFIQLSTLFDVSLDYLILGRYHNALPKVMDSTQLKTDIGELIDKLERLKSSL